MATVNVGNYAIHECQVEVKTTADTFASIADLEEFNINIESNVETWNSMSDGGWQNALMTGKALNGSFSGKRCFGDAGNDFLDGLRYENGRNAEADFKITFPNAATLEFTSVVALTEILGGATGVGPLTGDITGKGKPKFTPAN